MPARRYGSFEPVSAMPVSMPQAPMATAPVGGRPGVPDPRRAPRAPVGGMPGTTPPPAAPPPGTTPAPSSNLPGTGARGYLPAGPGGPGINLINNANGNPAGSPGQLYNHDLNDAWWPNNTNSPRGRMGYNFGDPLYWQDTPGFETKAWLGSVMQNPYAIPEASKRAAMSGVDDAYGTAAQRVRSDTLGSGAAGGGVARGVRGNVETARASGMANAIRDFQQQSQQVGDERLRTLGLPWIAQKNAANQTGYNAMLGQRNLDQQNNNSTQGEDITNMILKLYGMYTGARGQG